MFESVNRKKDPQGREQASEDNYWAPSWKKMLTPQQDGGAGPIQRHPDLYAGVADHPRMQYDLDAMLGSMGPGTRDPMPRTRPPLQMKQVIGGEGDKSEQESDRAADQVEMPTQLQTPNPPGENRTGMPDRLKAGLEQLSGLDLSGVRVHYNSAKPAQLNAHAYTQGQHIEVGPGQERHLPHEGWHVVQQMQGRVRPTIQERGVAINDDTALEREADLMGAKAAGGGKKI